MRNGRIVAIAAMVLVAVCVAGVGAIRLSAADGQVAPAEKRQAVVYLNGQQSLQMQGDSLPGYSGGTTALPFLLQNGWKLIAIHVADNAALTGYAVLEK